ncbi:MAG: energy transducer TonB [Deltaproteobacteria bacterium]|nr:energy transducer TonB [Deltaproteobacteria bacterium]
MIPLVAMAACAAPARRGAAVLVSPASAPVARESEDASTLPASQQVIAVDGDIVRIARAPKRIAGELQPKIPSSMIANLRGKTGVVFVRIVLAEDGAVAQVEIVRSTLPELDAVIVAHVRTWRFEPARLDGKAVRALYMQPFTFKF